MMVITRSRDAVVEPVRSMVSELPQELLDRICSFADISTLKSLRLTNHAFTSSATKSLFRHIEVQPIRESVQKCLAIMDDQRLSRQVTSIRFHTSTNPSAQEGDEDAYAALIAHTFGAFRHIKSFYRALSSLGKLVNLRQVSICFAERCAAGGDIISEAPEDINVRSRVLRALIEQKLPGKLNSLSLRNLQDLLPDVIAEAEGWKGLLMKVERLGVLVTSEGDDAAPERNLEFEALHRFYGRELQRKILMPPVREQLRELRLHANEIYWGHYPFFDVRHPDLYFPKLETLALGRMAFVHDWQLEWILSHAYTLKSLVLDNCPIFVAGRPFKDMEHHYEPPASNATIIGAGQYLLWTNPTRWHDYFRAFKGRLPLLTHFAISTASPDWNFEFEDWNGEIDSSEDPYALQNELQIGRYRLFDAGVGPSQVLDGGCPGRYVEDQDDTEGKLAAFENSWWERDLEGEDDEVKRAFLEGSRFPDCWGEDSRALGELMEVVEGRRMRRR